MSLTVGLVGVSYGATAVAAGLPIWFPVALGALVLAASSEFVFVGLLATGGGAWAGLVAGLLLNARHLPYGMAVGGDVVGRGWRRMFGTHLLNDESVVFTVAETTADTRRAAYWLSGYGIMLAWPTGALVGAVAGSVVGDTNSFGLDATFPCAVISLVFPALREPQVRRAALLGAAIALGTAFWLPPGLPVLLSLAALTVLLGRADAAAPATTTEQGR